MKVVKHLCSASGIEAGIQVSITAGETSLMDDAEAARWIDGGLAVMHEDQKSKPTHDRSTKRPGLANTKRPGTPPGGGSIPPGGEGPSKPAPDVDAEGDEDIEEVETNEGDVEGDPEGEPEGDPEGETGEESQVPPRMTKAEKKAAKAAARAAARANKGKV